MIYIKRGPYFWKDIMIIMISDWQKIQVSKGEWNLISENSEGTLRASGDWSLKVCC